MKTKLPLDLRVGDRLASYEGTRRLPPATVGLRPPRTAVNGRGKHVLLVDTDHGTVTIDDLKTPVEVE